MKIVQLIDALPSLQKLAKQDLSIRKLYQIEKLLNKLDVEIKFYYEQRDKLVQKYCNVDGGEVEPKEENSAQLETELNELLNTEIEEEFQEIAIGINEDVKLSYNDIVALKGIIRIEGE